MAVLCATRILGFLFKYKSDAKRKFELRDVDVGVGDCGTAAWWGAVRWFSNEAENRIQRRG